MTKKFTGEFTGINILLVIFLIKNFVKQELFCSNANKIKNPERWTFSKRHLVKALNNTVHLALAHRYI